LIPRKIKKVDAITIQTLTGSQRVLWDQLRGPRPDITRLQAAPPPLVGIKLWHAAEAGQNWA